MSTLDQAFIRAYQVGRSTNTPQAKPEPAAATVAAEAPALAPKSTPRTARTRHFVDSAHEGPSARHAADKQATAAAQAAEASAFSRTAYEPVYAHTALQRERSNLNDAGKTATGGGAVAEAEPEFRAAYETERFHWPRHVEVLIASAGNEFAQFVAELEERIDTGRKTLAVTGFARGEGRSTIVLSLARLLANRNRCVVIVEADLRQPQLAEMLGIRPELGWDDVYSERLPVTDALIESAAERITLLPMRSGFSNPRALAGNRTLAGIIDQLKRHYDAVLLDVGPLPDDQDTIDLAAALTGCKLDDALVVRDRRTTSPKDVQAVCRRLAVLGVHHCDIAENFTELQGY